jgi:hypothetical protein
VIAVLMTNANLDMIKGLEKHQRVAFKTIKRDAHDPFSDLL